MSSSILKLLLVIILVLIILLWLNSLGVFAHQVSPLYEWVRPLAATTGPVYAS